MYEPKYFINVSQLTFTKRDGRIYDSPFVHVREWNEEYNPVQEVKEEQNGQMMFVFT